MDWSSFVSRHSLTVTKCAFGDALLRSSVVTRAYLSYCRLPVSSKQSDRSLLTSDISEALSQRKPLLAGHFLFFVPFSANHGDGCVGKSLQISRFWNSHTPTTCHVQSDFLLHYDAELKLEQIILIIIICIIMTLVTRGSCQYGKNWTWWFLFSFL